MRRFVNLVVMILTVLGLLWMQSRCEAAAPASSPAPRLTSDLTTTPKKPPLPQVPITYAGDTNDTIIRRAQWIEGAKREGRLVWWATRSPVEAKEIIAEFNKIYPFIKVDHWRGTSWEIAAKLETEFIGGHYTVGVVLGADDVSLPRWRKMGMLAKYTDIIPGIEKWDTRMYSKHGDYALGHTTVLIPAYNTKLVLAAEAPKNWEDLLHPKWEGKKIGLLTSMRVWNTLAMGDGGWGIAKTEEFLTKLRQQVLMWASGESAAISLLTAGDFKIGVSSLHRVRSFQKKGAPLEWSRVNPIPIAGPHVIQPKKAPHPNAAALFLEWIFSPQGATVYEKVVGAGSVSPGSGTQQAKAVEGLNLCIQTEELLLKGVELGLEEKFAKILGVTPGKE